MLEFFTGVLQGITEFLPISSSGHLVIFSSLSQDINLNTNDIAFLHIGTLFSILIFYRIRIRKIFESTETFLFFLKVVVAGVIPAALVGFFTPIQNTIDESPQILLVTGISYLLFSILLIFSEKINNRESFSITELTINNAFLIGLAQSFALLPGVSRSGVTLITAMYLGMKKADAIYFSLLLGIPTIFGAWGLTFVSQSYELNSGIIFPTMVALITGVVAIKLLVDFTTNSKLQYFGYYCLLPVSYTHLTLPTKA